MSCPNVSRIVVLPCLCPCPCFLDVFYTFFFFFFNNVETFLKKSPLDSPLGSSKTYGQLTPPAKTSCRVIQCFILLIIGNVYFQSIFVSYDKREFKKKKNYVYTCNIRYSAHILLCMQVQVLRVVTSRQKC